VAHSILFLRTQPCILHRYHYQQDIFRLYIAPKPKALLKFQLHESVSSEIELASSASARLKQHTDTLIKKAYKTFVLSLVGLSFIIFWGGALVISWTYVPLFKALNRHDQQKRWRVNQRIIRYLFGLFCLQLRSLRLINIDPKRYETSQDDSAFVLLANHPTLIDVIVLLATYKNVCCVVKESVYKGILVGPLLQEAGYICGGQAQTTRVSEILAEGIERLNQGMRVLIFPEGTRSPTGDLHKFQRSGFEMAARAEVPIHITHIYCEPHVLRKGKPWYDMSDQFVKYEITELPSLTIQQGRNNVRTAMDTVRQQLLSFRP